MVQRAFNNIDRKAIEALIANKVGESKTLEYKQALPGFSDADKKEFLADVTSFANASGGDIIYGIKAEVDGEGKKTGKPDSPAPITNASPDEVKLRLEEVIRNGTDPRFKVQIMAVPGWNGDEGSFVLVIRIPRSFSSPHAVTYAGSFRFYTRNSAGKYRLDVDELRSAFMASESQVERIRRFREDRLARIVADETPVRLSAPERLVLHMVPVQSFLNRERLDLSDDGALAARFPPMGSSSSGYHRYNLDGLLTWESGVSQDPGAASYRQLFFDGRVEAVAGKIVHRRVSAETPGAPPVFSGVRVERTLIHACEHYLRGLETLGVLPPVTILVTALGWRGFCMAESSEHYFLNPTAPIDRDALLLPDVITEEFDVDVPKLMRSAFDALWNACGYAKSLNYDDEDTWNPKQ